MTADPHDAEVATYDDPVAFAAFYREFHPRVMALAARHFPGSDPDDVAQETMTRCYAKFADIDRCRNPWPFVSTVARNASTDSWRRTSRVVLTDELPEPPPDGDVTVDTVLVREQCRVVRTALTRLTASDRQLIEDGDLHGVPYDVMAAVRDMTTNTLRQRLYRARQKLEVELRRLGATLGVVPVAVQARFARLSRKLQDAGHAAGPAGAGALSAAAVAGVATVATILGGPGAAPAQAALQSSGRGDVVAAVERGTRPVARPARAEAAAPARAARTAGGASAGRTAARPAVPAPEPSLPFFERRYGNPADPRRPNGHLFRVETPLGPLEWEHNSTQAPGYSVLCAVGVAQCDPQPTQ